MIKLKANMKADDEPPVIREDKIVNDQLSYGKEPDAIPAEVYKATAATSVSRLSALFDSFWGRAQFQVNCVHYPSLQK